MRLIEYTSWRGLWRPVVKYSGIFAAVCAILMGLMILAVTAEIAPDDGFIINLTEGDKTITYHWIQFTVKGVIVASVNGNCEVWLDDIFKSGEYPYLVAELHHYALLCKELQQIEKRKENK